jgi:protein-L-isoaspartate(D-aspartate) O-methyltransferase
LYLVKNVLVVKTLMIISIIIMTGFLVPQADKFESIRHKMVETQIKARGISNQPVLDAMRKVPRHLFVPKEYEGEAYNDYPLPIGHGQTISQPYIVAYMTAAVRPSEKKNALEIGTGSGYQAAVLAEIVSKVYSVEIIPELATESAQKLKHLGYKNVECKAGDGYLGWPEHAPYDIIIVTAAAKEIPGPLIDQLAENGRLVIPVGEPAAVQELRLVTKNKGKTESTRLTFVRFVPFRRATE